MSLRSRNFFVILLVLGLLATSAVVIASKPSRLGLDLQGGVELVYQGKPTPQVRTIDAEAIDRALDILRKRVDKLGVSEPEISRSGRDQLIVSLPGEPNAKRAEEQVGTTAQLHFYDWEPNVLGADCQPSTEGDASVAQTPIVGKEEAVKRAAKCKFEPEPDDTTTGPTVYAFDASGREIGTGNDARDALSDTRTGRLPPGGHLYEVPRGTIVARAELPDDASDEQKRNWDRWFVAKDDPELSGTDITNPEQNYDQQTNEPIVTMDFTDEGREAFQSVTRRIAQRGAEQPTTIPPEQRLQSFAIVLDNELVSRPTIDFQEYPDGIDGSTGAQISGNFTTQTAQDLAEFLKIGALPIKLELISRSQVSATLGKQALDQGLVAGLAGLGIVALFLVTFYRVLGLIAVGALCVYAAYFFALAKLIPITLTLPGIAGAILTIGVAADANIVVFERVKEEIRAGRSIPAAIAAGYKKGFATILDANVATLLVAFILFILATAGVKGFALTLGIGTIVSLFTAVLATQAILLSMRNSRVVAHRSALGAGEQKRRIRIDFMGYSKWFFSASGIILLIGALGIANKGIDFGIEFESGTRIKTPLERPVDIEKLRDTLASSGFDNAKVQTLDDPELGSNVVQIAAKDLPPQRVERVRALLDREYGVPERGFSQDSVGPTFGESVAESAIYAIIASLIVIAIYIGLRFQWKFAVPVLIALMHDLLITAGVYALVDREVTTSTVAALLSILGFSLYDTIIVFDRIRENMPRMPNATFSQIVNRSMSEVIVRSLATSFCTLLPVLALFGFGGDTLKDFAFALIVGTFSGTYSSVFIASPVLCHWKEREKVYRARDRRVRAAFGGIVPAYAVAAAGVGPVDVAPAEPRRSRRQRLTSDPSEGVTREEFDEMVADLHVEPPPDAGRSPAATPSRSPGRSSSRKATPPPETSTPEPAPREQAATGPVKRTGRRAARRAAREAGEPLPPPGVAPEEREEAASSPTNGGAGEPPASDRDGDGDGDGRRASSAPKGGRRQQKGKRRHGRHR